MNFEAILSEGKRAFADATLIETCLSSDVLIDYEYDELEEAARQEAASHISGCNACRMSLLSIEADRAEWESRLEGSPDDALAEIFGAAGRAVIDPFIQKSAHKTGILQSTITQLKEALIQWTSPLWEPMWAGQMVTAADRPEQSHLFELGDGEYVNVTCFWSEKSQGTVSQFRLSWEANLYSPSNIWVRLVDPETQEILHELPLGNDLTGKRLIDREALGFDPSNRRFALSVLIEAQ
jgi:hypothetical protein